MCSVWAGQVHSLLVRRLTEDPIPNPSPDTRPAYDELICPLMSGHSCRREVQLLLGMMHCLGPCKSLNSDNLPQQCRPSLPSGGWWVNQGRYCPALLLKTPTAENSYEDSVHIQLLDV